MSLHSFATILVIAASLILQSACAASEEISTQATVVPRYTLGHEPISMPLGANGRAEIVVPVGQALLALMPLTDKSGEYAFTITGTLWPGAASAVSQAGLYAGFANAAPVMPTSTVLQPTTSPTTITLSDTLSFQVPAGRKRSGEFLSVTAQKVIEGARVVLYSEETGGMVAEVAPGLVAFVDRVALPEEERIFGPVPDVDGNGKIILLLTDSVGRYSEEPGAFTGGFFASKDLTGAKGSNHADMLYLYLPKPTDQGGVYDHADDYQALLREVIVHELQHMISLGVRLSRAAKPEAAWLNEGLSHWAEGYFGFYRSNRIRARYFLQSPSKTPLVGRGESLAERGAAFLFVKYLIESMGGEPTFASRLVQSNKNGLANVEAAVGKKIDHVLAGWLAYLYQNNADTLHVEAMADVKPFSGLVANLAPAILKVTGPAVLYVQAEPGGHFSGFGQALESAP